LDECVERYGWHDIDFLKIDAEGEETKILLGGERFFKEFSPLVQFEIKEGSNQHLGLVQNFAALGYDAYRLVPGLDLLVPFGVDSTPDPFLLNLFCCKRDRAERLIAQGFLLDPAAYGSTTVPEQRANAQLENVKNSNVYHWRNTLAKLPYGAQLVHYWERTMGAGNSAEVDKALSLYARSRDSSISPGERFAALEASYSRLKILCERDASYLRLASLARVARDYGARSLAVNALQRLGNAIVQQNQVDPTEPFLAPSERFDLVPPGEVICNWVLAAVLEEIERLSQFSSFFDGVSAKQRLEVIRGLGFGSAEMDRRLQLVRARGGEVSS
jgi:protein O-GlcNAc transferase